MVLGCEPLADRLLWRLEGTYALTPAELAVELEALQPGNGGGDGDQTWIVVLGSGHVQRREYSPLATISSGGRARVARGVELARQLPEARVIFSGGSLASSAPDPGDPASQVQSIADVAAGAARTLGLEEERIITLPHPLDTASEAQAVAELLQRPHPAGPPPTQILLVTSASHLPRAMGYFNTALTTTQVIPVIAEIRAGAGPYTPWSWIPSSRGLEKSTILVYEVLGLTVQYITRNRRFQ